MANKKRRGAGEGTVYQRESGDRKGQWVAQIRVGINAETGKARVKTVYGDTQREALEKLDGIRTARRAGTVADPGRMTVADLVKSYLNAKAAGLQVRTTTLALYRHTLEKHVVARIGVAKLSVLQPVHVDDWIADLDRDKVGYRARQAAFDGLKRTLAYGVSLGLLAHNPADRAERPKVELPDVKPLMADQANHLLDMVEAEESTWIYAVIVLGLLCGLRRGETLGLAWRDVDLDAPEPFVRVRQQVTETANTAATVGQLKSKSARRTVPLTDRAVAALRAIRLEVGATPFPEFLLFNTRTGKPHSPTGLFGRVMKPLFTRAGFPWLSFHGLRHSFATLALGSGTDIVTLQRMLGHSRASMTLDVYAGFVPANATDAIKRLGKLLG